MEIRDNIEKPQEGILYERSQRTHRHSLAVGAFSVYGIMERKWGGTSRDLRKNIRARTRGTAIINTTIR